MDEIKKQGNDYIKIGLMSICAIHSVIVIVRMIFGFSFEVTLNANLISTLFAVAVVVAAGTLWKKVARKPDLIPSFHMGVSVVRLLLALAVIFIYLLTLDTEAEGYDPDTKLIFLVIFAVYYIQLLVHHSLFHSRQNKVNDNEKI